MTDHEASRTLVKSTPELWAECSDATSLAKHLGAFGEIRITRLEPETTVAWEGDAASGTVRLEPSAWGTRVVLTSTSATAVPEPAAMAPDHGPPAEAEPADAQYPSEPPVSSQAAAPELEPAREFEPAAEVQRTPELERTPEVERAPLGVFARLIGRLGWGRRERDLTPASAETVPAVDATASAETMPAVDATASSETMPAVDATASADTMPAVPVEQPAPIADALDAALDSLGRAHHRPYSRS